jgi:uncharacterized phage protein (TIGR01671 family)
MREYKFRGKRIDNGEWVYGFYYRIQNDDSTYDHYIKEDTTRHLANVMHTLWCVDPETVDQYTGRKDKTGKDIYEGDAFGSKQLRCIVKRDDDGAYRLHFVDERISPISILDPKVSQSVVIGNIYQSPDLIK